MGYSLIPHGHEEKTMRQDRRSLGLLLWKGSKASDPGMTSQSLATHLGEVFTPKLCAQGLAEAPVIASLMPLVKINWFSVLAQSRIFSFLFPVCLESTFVAEYLSSLREVVKA